MKNICVCLIIVTFFYYNINCEDSSSVTIKSKVEINKGLVQKLNFKSKETIKRSFIDNNGAVLIESKAQIEIELAYTVEILEVDEFKNCSKSKVVFEKAIKKYKDKILVYPLELETPYFAEFKNNVLKVTLNNEEVNGVLFDKLNLLPQSEKEVVYKDVPLGVKMSNNTIVEKFDETIDDKFVVLNKIKSYKLDKIENDAFQKDLPDYMLSVDSIGKYKMKEDKLVLNKLKICDLEERFEKIRYINLNACFVSKIIFKKNERNSFEGFSESAGAFGKGSEEREEIYEREIKKQINK